MNPKVKKLWLAALPKYKQGRGKMRQKRDGEYRYCCLGVLQMVALENGVQFDPMWKDNYIPPPEVLRWAGLNTTACYSAAARNDGTGPHHKHSFEEIAAWIKKSL